MEVLTSIQAVWIWQWHNLVLLYSQSQGNDILNHRADPCKEGGKDECDENLPNNNIGITPPLTNSDIHYSLQLTIQMQLELIDLTGADVTSAKEWKLLKRAFAVGKSDRGVIYYQV